MRYMPKEGPAKREDSLGRIKETHSVSTKAKGGAREAGGFLRHDKKRRVASQQKPKEGPAKREDSLGMIKRDA